MCGFIGFIGRKALGSKDATKRVLTLMSKRLDHRGPDSNGYWLNLDGSVAIAHRRLSIVDLTNAGNQPMVSESKRYIIAYNGEIYNHRELRDLINQETNITFMWRGNSDTETLLDAVELWGLERTLEKIEGMFAFGLWDKKEKKLFLVRDRFGEKPLFFYKNPNFVAFSSELKSLSKFPLVDLNISRKSSYYYSMLGYVLKKAKSTFEKSKSSIGWTSIVLSSPKLTCLPGDFDEANAYTLSTGKSLSYSVCSISLPTAPVEPTTAILYVIIVSQLFIIIH